MRIFVHGIVIVGSAFLFCFAMGRPPYAWWWTAITLLAFLTLCGTCASLAFLLMREFLDRRLLKRRRETREDSSDREDSPRVCGASGCNGVVVAAHPESGRLKHQSARDLAATDNHRWH